VEQEFLLKQKDNVYDHSPLALTEEAKEIGAAAVAEKATEEKMRLICKGIKQNSTYGRSGFP